MENKPSLKKNLAVLIILTISGSIIYSLPYFRSYYYASFMEYFGMTNTQMGLCGTSFGLMAVPGYLFGGFICDRFSIKKLIPFSMIVTGAMGLLLLTKPSPLIIIVIHGIWSLTSLMTFWPALMKTIRALAAPDEQGKAFGIYEGGRGVSNAVYLSIAAMIFGRLSMVGTEGMGVRGVVIFYSAISIGLGALDIVLLRNFKDQDAISDDSGKVNFRMMIRPMKMPTIWLMIGIIFATLTVSTGYYYISPYATEVYGTSALLAVILSSSSQYIRPFAAMGAGVLGDKINSSKVMLLGQIGNAAALGIVLLARPSFGIMPIVIASIMLFFMMYVCVTMQFAIMEEIDVPKECEGTAIGLICSLGYLPEATSPFVAGRILDLVPGTTGYRLFFIYMIVITVIGIALTCIWFKMTKEKRVQILEDSKKKKQAMID